MQTGWRCGIHQTVQREREKQATPTATASRVAAAAATAASKTIAIETKSRVHVARCHALPCVVRLPVLFGGSHCVDFVCFQPKVFLLKIIRLRPSIHMWAPIMTDALTAQLQWFVHTPRHFLSAAYMRYE